MTDLTDNELKALSYHAIGVSSEEGDKAYRLTLCGRTMAARDGRMTLYPEENSGYAIGTLQVDLGQSPETGRNLVAHFQSWARVNHPDWVLDEQQRESFTRDLNRDGRTIRKANHDIDQTVKSHLNTYLGTDDGKDFVHQQDVAQVNTLTTRIGTPLRTIPFYRNASPEDQARIYVTIAKAFNQNEGLGGEILRKARQGKIDSLAAINTKIDDFSEDARTGRQGAMQGVDQFIALRSAGEGNSMRAPWQAVVADPLVSPGRLDQDPKQPHLRDQYATVRGSFVDPVQGRAFVTALESSHGSHNYGSPSDSRSRGFYVEGRDFVQWDSDGHGRAFVGGKWTELRRDELTVTRNPDHTLDLHLTRNGQTETLLHVTHPTPSRAEAAHAPKPAATPGPKPDAAIVPPRDARGYWYDVAARNAPSPGSDAASTVAAQPGRDVGIGRRPGL